MPKSGYYTSIAALENWFNAPGNKEYNKFEIKSTDEKGNTLYGWDAPDHEQAWTDCKEKLEGYGAGLFWIKFHAGKGVQAATGLDLTFGQPNTQQQHQANHIGLPNGMTMDMYTELLTYRIKKEHDLGEKKSNSLIAGIFDTLKANPDATKAAVDGVNGLLAGIMGLAASYLPQPPQQGVGIAGLPGGETIRFHHKRIVEAGDYPIRCKCFTMINESDDYVTIDNERVAPGTIIEMPHIVGSRGYDQVVGFGGKTVNIFLKMVA